MSALTDLLILADLYGASLGKAESTVSSQVFSDGKRLRALRAGTSDVGVRRAERAVQWFSDHWPPDMPWPAGIDRPEPGREA